MKVIKYGQKPEEKLYRATCRYCTTEVEFMRGEAEYISDQRDGDTLTVVCPVCNGLIYKSL